VTKNDKPKYVTTPSQSLPTLSCYVCTDFIYQQNKLKAEILYSLHNIIQLQLLYITTNIKLHLYKCLYRCDDGPWPLPVCHYKQPCRTFLGFSLLSYLR